MRKQTWLLLYIIVLIVHLAGILAKYAFIQQLTKPLLLPLLVLYFISNVGKERSALKKWIIAALFFSWAGDVLLMFVPKNEVFFLLGLGSFLLAHIFYIFYFHTVKTVEQVKSRPMLLLIVAIYYASLITILFPYLGSMKVPVLVYGVVISFMFLQAMHMLFIANKTAGQYMMIGALLFVLSDSILALNKFYQPFEWAGFAIMLTYGLAQLFIVLGAIQYIKSVKKE